MADPSDALLIHLLRPDAPPLDRLPEADWQAIYQRALDELLLPLLHERLLPVLDQLPPHLAEALTYARRITAAHRMVQSMALASLVAAFDKATIPLIAYKGGPLTRQLYGDSSLRLSSDIDLIVREADWARGCELLAALGWANEGDWMNHRDFVLTQGDVETKVELHRGTNREGDYYLPDELLWRETLLTEEGRLFTPEMTFFTMVLHAERHAFEQLRLLVDLAHALARWKERLDWPKVRTFAEQAGALPLLAFTLALLGREFETGLPDEPGIRRAMGTARVQRALRFFSTERLLRERKYPAFFRHGLAVMIGAYKRPTILLADFLRTPSEIAHRYELPQGSKRVYLYYLLRPFRVSATYLHRLLSR